MVESKPGVRSRKVSNEVKQPVDSRARLFQAKLRNLKLKEKRAAEEKAVPPEPPAPLLPEVVRDVAMVPCPCPRWEKRTGCWGDWWGRCWSSSTKAWTT